MQTNSGNVTNVLYVVFLLQYFKCKSFDIVLALYAHPRQPRVLMLIDTSGIGSEGQSPKKDGEPRNQVPEEGFESEEG